MTESALRTAARKAYLGLLTRRSEELRAEDLRTSAIVFSPHPDDETLGCGGTIIRMTKEGTWVQVVFMTDGRRSHRAFMDEEELARLRKAEGQEACRRLGVPSEGIHFLGIHNAKLAVNRKRALADVGEILESSRPRQVFIPYGRDPPVGSTDHGETSSIVLEALGMAGSKATILEYPVWYWRHWPMVSLPGGAISGARFAAKSVLWALTFLKDLNCRSNTAADEEVKRYALEAHRTQVSRYLPDPGWKTLADVSCGQFLECFFMGVEFFHRHPLQS